MIVVVMGVSGSGKSTIGQMLAARLGWDFYEGDSFHPQHNIEKMAQGTPLTDEDRAGWLASIAEQISLVEQEKQNGVITCSALKKSYRDKLEAASKNIKFVFLHGQHDLLNERLNSRTGHFMKSKLLHSQLETLEEPKDALKFDISDTPEKIIGDIIRILG